MNKQLKKSLDKVNAADDQLQSLLAKQYPLLTVVYFYIMHGQVTPSSGEVVGHEGGIHGYLRVRLNSRTRPVRSIPVKYIIN